MTNNREEQIRNKAKELGQAYFPDSANIWARSNVEATYVEYACVEMAKWLDQHPNWISVKNEQPPKTTDWANPKYFLGLTEEGGIHKMYRMGDPTICKDFENEQLYLHVTHWMPIVPPRKEE